MDQKRKKYIASRVAELFIKINAVNFRFNPPFTFTSGLKSPIYLDNRIVMSYPRVRREIVHYYIQIIEEIIGLKKVNYISATASAAIPHGAWISGELNLPMVFIRPTTKSYGKGSKIEGHLAKGSKVVIIEDHISTATSVVNNGETIRSVGGKVRYCIASTTYETGISKKLLKENKIVLIALTTGREIVEAAYKKGIITKKEKESVDEWFKNPQAWAKKMGVE